MTVPPMAEKVITYGKKGTKPPIEEMKNGSSDPRIYAIKSEAARTKLYKKLKKKGYELYTSSQSSSSQKPGHGVNR